MAAAARGDAERLARLAHEETGFGNVKDKTAKNLFAAVDVHAYIRPAADGRACCARTGAPRVVEIAEPMGVVAAVIPSTNPTSTAIFKALVAIKARNAVRDVPASLGPKLHPGDGARAAPRRGGGGASRRTPSPA